MALRSETAVILRCLGVCDLDHSRGTATLASTGGMVVAFVERGRRDVDCDGESRMPVIPESATS
eukprot:9394271-Alexandrium_andersonii.AAC.1